MPIAASSRSLRSLDEWRRDRSMPVTRVPLHGYSDLVAGAQRRARLVCAALRSPEGVYRVNKSQQIPNEDVRLVRFGRPSTSKSGNHHRSETKPLALSRNDNSAAARLTYGAFVLASGSVQRARAAGLQHVGR